MQSDGVLFAGITGDGRRGYGFEGADLIRFIRRVLLAMMEAGARPVLGGGESGFYWLVQKQFGLEPAEIVDNVISDWVARGMQEEDLGGLWFTVRDCYESRWR